MWQGANNFRVIIRFLNFIYLQQKIFRMECREGCGACCIVLSISSEIPGMPMGKPAGVRCIHLTGDYRCAIYESPLKPAACSGFTPEPEFCGSDREEAMRILSSLAGVR
jgi:Fe-S-cluster containining protein